MLHTTRGISKLIQSSIIIMTMRTYVVGLLGVGLGGDSSSGMIALGAIGILSGAVTEISATCPKRRYTEVA